MISPSQLVVAADKAARGAQIAVGAKGNWLEGTDLSPSVLAHYLTRYPDVPAEALYIFATSGVADAKPWTEAGAPVRVAFETFRATYGVLARLVTVPEPVAIPEPAHGTFGKRVFERRSRAALGARVDLGDRRK